MKEEATSDNDDASSLDLSQYSGTSEIEKCGLLGVVYN